MSNVRAMDPKARHTWIPKCDQNLPKEEQFKIFYHPLEMRKEATISDEQFRSITKGKKSEYKSLMGQADIKRMELTIEGWDNLTYPDNHPELAGTDVPFDKENIGLIPPEIRSEFVGFITGRDKDEEDGIDLGEAETA